MINVDQLSVAADGVTLLAPVSLHMQRGETLIVRGRNGAGKTTFLRVLAGMQQPSQGPGWPLGTLPAIILFAGIGSPSRQHWSTHYCWECSL